MFLDIWRGPQIISVIFQELCDWFFTMLKISSPNLSEDDWTNQNESQFSLNLLWLSLRVKFGFIFLFLIFSPSLIKKNHPPKINKIIFNELAKPVLSCLISKWSVFSFVAKNWKRADEHQLKFYLFLFGLNLLPACFVILTRSL